jgi:hypothetical protein
VPAEDVIMHCLLRGAYNSEGEVIDEYGTTGSGKPKKLENTPQCHIVHYEHDVHSARIETETPR